MHNVSPRIYVQGGFSDVFLHSGYQVRVFILVPRQERRDFQFYVFSKNVYNSFLVFRKVPEFTYGVAYFFRETFFILLNYQWAGAVIFPGPAKKSAPLSDKKLSPFLCVIKKPLPSAIDKTKNKCPLNISATIIVIPRF